jgi:hypothetical protein
VKLQTILMPVSEYNHSEKGDALYGKSYSVIILPCNYSRGGSKGLKV